MTRRPGLIGMALAAALGIGLLVSAVLRLASAPTALPPLLGVGPSASGSVRLEVSPDQVEIAAGTTLTVRITITNASDRPLTVRFGRLKLVFLDADRNVILPRGTFMGTPAPPAGPDLIILQPGAVHVLSRPIVLLEPEPGRGPLILALHRGGRVPLMPGAHFLEAELQGSEGGLWQGEVRSDPVPITVAGPPRAEGGTEG